MIRNMAEKVSRGVSFWRRLPEEFGRVKMRVSPESGGLRYWKFNLRGVDSHLLDFVSEVVRPGMSAWDIGANLGLFSFSAAAKAGTSGQVVAVEPDVDNQKLLLRTIRANRGNIADVSVLGVAVAKPPTRFANFEISDRSRASNKLAGFGNSQFGGTAETRAVVIVTLDEMLQGFRPPDVVKMDVEGAEVDALLGGPKLIHEVRPIFTIEVGGENCDAVTKILLDAGYLLFDGEKPKAQRKPIAIATWNTIAVHREKAANFGYSA